MTTPRQVKKAKEKSNRLYLIGLLLVVFGLMVFTVIYRIQYIKGLEG